MLHKCATERAACLLSAAATARTRLQHAVDGEGGGGGRAVVAMLQRDPRGEAAAGCGRTTGARRRRDAADHAGSSSRSLPQR